MLEDRYLLLKAKPVRMEIGLQKRAVDS